MPTDPEHPFRDSFYCVSPNIQGKPVTNDSEPKLVISSHFQTPLWCCKYMTGLLPPGIRTVLEPTPGLGNLSGVLVEAGYLVEAPSGDFFKQNWEGKHYDAVVMNPPFTPPAVGYNIMFQCMEMSARMICLQPWEAVINGERRLKRIMDFGLKSISHLPRKTFPGARVRCCVLELVKGYKGAVEFHTVEAKKE